MPSRGASRAATASAQPPWTALGSCAPPASVPRGTPRSLHPLVVTVTCKRGEELGLLSRCAQQSEIQLSHEKEALSPVMTDGCGDSAISPRGRSRNAVRRDLHEEPRPVRRTGAEPNGGGGVAGPGAGGCGGPAGRVRGRGRPRRTGTRSRREAGPHAGPASRSRPAANDTVATPRGLGAPSSPEAPHHPLLNTVVSTEELRTKQSSHMSFFLLSIYFKIN